MVSYETILGRLQGIQASSPTELTWLELYNHYSKLFNSMPPPPDPFPMFPNIEALAGWMYAIQT